MQDPPIILLLQTAISCIATSAFRGETDRSRHEVRFANTIFSVLTMQTESAVQIVKAALSSYRQANVPESNRELKCRAEAMYLGFVNSMLNESMDNNVKLELGDRGLALQLLTVGLALTTKAIDASNLKLAYIEADHIHNVPIMLLPNRVQTTTYYFKEERDLYLCRLGESENCDAVANAVHLFGHLWSELGRELCIDS